MAVVVGASWPQLAGSCRLDRTAAVEMPAGPSGAPCWPLDPVAKVPGRELGAALALLWPRRPADWTGPLWSRCPAGHQVLDRAAWLRCL
ncbi:MAG: hypothetical protein ABSA53_20960 [Streptosporangiaceae bacterium]